MVSVSHIDMTNAMAGVVSLAIRRGTMNKPCEQIETLAQRWLSCLAIAASRCLNYVNYGTSHLWHCPGPMSASPLGSMAVVSVPIKPFTFHRSPETSNISIPMCS